MIKKFLIALIHDEICRRAKPMLFAEDRYYRNENGNYMKDKVGKNTRGIM